jgi:hypothetical protein
MWRMGGLQLETSTGKKLAKPHINEKAEHGGQYL